MTSLFRNEYFRLLTARKSNHNAATNESGTHCKGTQAHARTEYSEVQFMALCNVISACYVGPFYQLPSMMSQQSRSGDKLWTSVHIGKCV
jgi:hypothetical protein